MATKLTSFQELAGALRVKRQPARQVLCDYCGKPAELVPGIEIYAHRRDLADLQFWRCKPCGAHVGTHKNSPDFAPMGRLANAELRRLKMVAHAHFDRLWKDGPMSRSKAYAELSRRMGLPPEKTHIGMFEPAQCIAVVTAVRDIWADLAPQLPQVEPELLA